MTDRATDPTATRETGDEQMHLVSDALLAACAYLIRFGDKDTHLAHTVLGQIEHIRGQQDGTALAAADVCVVSKEDLERAYHLGAVMTRVHDLTLDEYRDYCRLFPDSPTAKREREVHGETRTRHD